MAVPVFARVFHYDALEVCFPVQGYPIEWLTGPPSFLKEFMTVDLYILLSLSILRFTVTLVVIGSIE